MVKRSLTLLLMLALSGCATAPRQPAQLILTNGKIFTSDPTRPAAEALAIREGRIVAIGSVAAVAKFADNGTRIMDLQGRVVVPGFNDAHYHTDTPPPERHVELGTMEPTLDAVEEALRRAAAASSSDMWLVATVGGRVLDDPRANRQTLDAISLTHPIRVHTWFAHGTIYNSRALQLLGFRDDQPDPSGGFFARDSSGRITGLVHEYAGHIAHRRFNSLTSRDNAIRRLASNGQLAARLGLTSVQEMSTVRRADEQARLLAAAQVPIRWRVIRFPLTIAPGWLSTESSQEAASTGGIRINGIKWILDGTPVERFAFMREPYQDKPEWRGRLNFSLDEIARMLRESAATGEQPMFHAVGDGAIEALLTVMESTGGPAFWRERRVRLEHADFLASDQMERARSLGVVIVHNPTHSLPELMNARYSPAVAQRVQPLRSLLRAGIPLAIGSDGPLSPFLNIMLAVVHPANPAEALSRQEAVSAYTRGSAYAEFAERDKGMLREGMLADLVVLSADIFTIPVQQLPSVESVLTVVGGTVVHDAMK